MLEDYTDRVRTKHLTKTVTKLQLAQCTCYSASRAGNTFTKCFSLAYAIFRSFQYLPRKYHGNNLTHHVDEIQGAVTPRDTRAFIRTSVTNSNRPHRCASEHLL